MVDGDYAVTNGAVIALSEKEAALQRILLALKTKRGSFPLLPEYGSRLHLLLQEKPSARESMAAAYVQELLAQERDVTLDALELTQVDGKTLLLTLQLRWQEEAVSTSVTIGGEA